MKTRNTKKGFTIIETTLATMFLGIIVLAVANLIIQMTNIYQKGLALRGINTVGQQLVEDMEKRINSADYVYDIDSNHDGYVVNDEIITNINKYFREWNVGTNDERQIAGAFCISDYTYVWNSAVALNDADPTKGVLIKYNHTDEETGTVSVETTRFKFARTYDPNHLVCTSKWLAGSGSVTDPNQTTYSGNSYTLDMTLSNQEPVEMINDDEVNLAIYDLTVHPVTQSTITKQSFVTVSFVLATLRGGVNIMSNSDYCQGTDDVNGVEYNSMDFAYCAVNKFDFSMRTGGNSSKNG